MALNNVKENVLIRSSFLAGHTINKKVQLSVVDTDLELREGGGGKFFVLFLLGCFSFCDFHTHNKGA